MAERSHDLELVEPVGLRVLVRKDEERRQTKGGIHLPDEAKIPVITGRIVSISKQVRNDPDYPLKQYDRVLVNPSQAIPVDFEQDNKLFIVPVEDVVAVLRKTRRKPGPAGGGSNEHIVAPDEESSDDE